MKLPARTTIAADADACRHVDVLTRPGLPRSASLWQSLWLILGLLFPPLVHAADVAQEYPLKAVFLWRLAQFTTWPTNAFESANNPIVIGVLGDNPFGDALDVAVRGETAHGRNLIVQRYRRVEEVKTCHILYISQSEARRLKEILAALAGRSILTVSDIEDFTRAEGGMIQFLTEQNKIKLRINLAPVKQANLTLDARLLRVSDVIPNP